MQTMLGPGAIGIKGVTLAEAIGLAQDAGFGSVGVDVAEAAALAEDGGVGRVRALFDEAGVRPGSWNVPVNWRKDGEREAGLARLPALAALARELGTTRATSGVMPGSDERPYDENLAWHAERLRPVAEALAGAGCRLGLEFIGPKTFRAPFRHEFVFSLPGALDLAAAIGTGNVGVLLDAWHLHTSGGQASDLDRLSPDDVVAVHVNDAPAGVTRDELIDTVRALPLETGVIDLVGFMAALGRLGYDGPVMPEPFSARLDAIAATDPAAAAREAARSMDDLWQAAGLA